MGKLTDVSTTVGGVNYTNSYDYANDLLSTITHNGFDYNLDYNAFGQPTTVSVGTQNLVTNTYKTSDRSYLLDYLTYGNGGKVDYTYDSRYRVSAIAYDNESSPRYTYTYAANDQLGSVTDTQNGLTTNLYYDLADRPMKTVEKYSSGLTRTFQYTYDIDNCLTHFIESFGTTQYKTVLEYDKDNRITAVSYNPANDPPTSGTQNVRYAYDALGRLYTRTLETGTNGDYLIKYHYVPGDTTDYGSGAKSNLVSYIETTLNGITSSLTYTYDECGRILSVTNSADAKTIHYTYDALGQLTRTDDPTDTTADPTGSTWAYAYDAGGNITTKKLYNYAYGDDDLSDNTADHTYTYTYDPTWKDELTSYDGNAITYEQSGNIGNPYTYNGWTFTWEAGRQLKQMSKGSTTLQFKYNNAGKRTQKINGSNITKYYWNGTNLGDMTTGGDILHFWYDAANNPAMVTYDGVNYYYLENQQGDIIGLLDASGTQQVAYTYDSWGKLLSVKDGDGTDESNNPMFLGNINPLRYKGYIYDNETGLYYLESRYYNPEWGRFLNSDGNLRTINIFAYCKNNPISYSDRLGTDGEDDVSDDEESVDCAGVPSGDTDLDALEINEEKFEACDPENIWEKIADFLGLKKAAVSKYSLTDDGKLTNGKYIVSDDYMKSHLTPTLDKNGEPKSQFYRENNALTDVLDACDIADNKNLWTKNHTAYVDMGHPVGTIGRDNTETSWICVSNYNGYVHGWPAKNPNGDQ